MHAVMDYHTPDRMKIGGLLNSNSNSSSSNNGPSTYPLHSRYLGGDVGSGPGSDDEGSHITQHNATNSSNKQAPTQTNNNNNRDTRSNTTTIQSAFELLSNGGMVTAPPRFQMSGNNKVHDRSANSTPRGVEGSLSQQQQSSPTMRRSSSFNDVSADDSGSSSPLQQQQKPHPSHERQSPPMFSLPPLNYTFPHPQIKPQPHPQSQSHSQPPSPLSSQLSQSQQQQQQQQKPPKDLGTAISNFNSILLSEHSARSPSPPTSLPPLPMMEAAGSTKSIDHSRHKYPGPGAPDMPKEASWMERPDLHTDAEDPLVVNRKLWTPEECLQLMELVVKYDPQSYKSRESENRWRAISNSLGRTVTSTRKKYMRLMNKWSSTTTGMPGSAVASSFIGSGGASGNMSGGGGSNMIANISSGHNVERKRSIHLMDEPQQQQQQRNTMVHSDMHQHQQYTRSYGPMDSVYTPSSPPTPPRHSVVPREYPIYPLSPRQSSHPYHPYPGQPPMQALAGPGFHHHHPYRQPNYMPRSDAPPNHPSYNKMPPSSVSPLLSSSSSPTSGLQEDWRSPSSKFLSGYESSSPHLPPHHQPHPPPFHHGNSTSTSGSGGSNSGSIPPLGRYKSN
ncbi:hypothetical protein SAMD00019534_115460 [Acytostelium subglobosum LB1]|uniref:hypothetical protein n=1 Tax=Acytostelium subglobosum LB1 TaxID=1410327 RepID=UPI00064497D8|nr:hypothetical protein SAMD00019534_115460 [Acytostelium subglobosum LB1]GAM28370.1 hypothetical protein SAMD00019534_115460 [Acytostelium subglobosum LB1]|eukprot:XP_012748687.1 hypothetical protein SAMD00019534_115460 [Acytostelium subglobosum LB1]